MIFSMYLLSLLGRYKNVRVDTKKEFYGF